MTTTLNDEALALFRSLVLHVATGSPLTDGERQSVHKMAVHLGATVEGMMPPLTLDVLDTQGVALECNAESEMELMQIGATVWLACHLIRLSGDIDRRRRRVARDLVDYFERRRPVLGLDVQTPVLLQYLKYIPHLRASERSPFLSGAWIPTVFMHTAPDFEHLTWDRLFQTQRARLTLYKTCLWFAVASGRRNASVIDCLAAIRTELRLDKDPRCLAISAAIVESTSAGPLKVADPARTMPLAKALASWVVRGAEGGQTPRALIHAIPETDRLAALCHVFDAALRENGLSPQSVGCIARVVDAIDPSEGELTPILMRFELDSGRRIRLPRAYTLDYSKEQLRYRRVRA
jgi:hypothetical protein